MNPIEKILNTKEYIIVDGGMGTMLMNAGLTNGSSPEEWNVQYPERVLAIHRSYIDAGSQIILTNTFGGTRFRLKLHNLQTRVAELNQAAAQIARQAADAAPHRVVVGGSLGPSGEILQPLGTLQFDEAREGFAEQAAALAEGGVDVFWVETMSDLSEVRAAIEGVKSVSDLPIVSTMTFDTSGRTMMGVTPAQALAAMREMGAAILGGNCGNGPAEIENVIHAMHEIDPDMILVAKANAGIPELVAGEVSYSGTPELMAEYAVRVYSLGARVIGACCGSTPAHIRAMTAALKANEDNPIEVVLSPTVAPPHAKRKRERRRMRR